MSEDKKYFTAVFPFTELYAKSNPFTTDTPWGRPIAVAVGDLTHENDAYLEALTEIAGSADPASVIAQGALDEVNEYIREQMKLPTEKAEPVEDGDAINAKAMGK